LPCSVSVYPDTEGGGVLFGEDIHGPFLKEFGANTSHWQKSIEKLLAFKADTLCEGRFGIYQFSSSVPDYIEVYLDKYGV
jgi:hypothetical protein